MHEGVIWDGRRPPVALSIEPEKQQERQYAVAPTLALTRPGLPNYLVGGLIVLLLAVMVFAAQTFYWKGQVDVEIKRIDELKALVDELKIYNQHTREQFALHGWQIDSQGNITNMTADRK